MTRYEKIKSMSKPELVTFLCDLWLLSTDKDDPCTICPMAKECRVGHTGWLTFLNEEWDEKYTTGMKQDLPTGMENDWDDAIGTEEDDMLADEKRRAL